MPRLDSRSCFGRLLGWEQSGFCQVAPAGPHEVRRRYIPETLVLETMFVTAEGAARIVDCFTMRRGGEHHPHQQLLRIMEGIRGQIELEILVSPRFDYGAIKPWIRRRRDHHYLAIGGADGLLISADFELDMDGRHDLRGACQVGEGERARLSLLYRPPEELDEGQVRPPAADELDGRLDETIAWWRAWSSKTLQIGRYAEQALRSAIVLKGLTNAPTGAIAAAATTSLPESGGGGRNWDYRFSWIRDSSFAVRSLAELGHASEADGFRRFVERSAAGSSEELQILFGLGGERRLYEYEVSEMEGYRGAKPVRIGNAAESQVQLDVYGELLNLAWRWHGKGASPDDDYWEFLVELVNAAARLWKSPDRGIWEIRGKPRHFVHSKAMCWAALERGIRLAEDLGRDAPVGSWKQARTEVRDSIEAHGYEPTRGVFIQAFDHPRMDSALLLLPMAGFVDYEDPRMVRTTDAIRNELSQGGLLRRYPPDDDGFEGTEGVFLACSFWLAECLARQQRVDEAHEIFQRAVSTGNDLGLFPEEYDTANKEMLGNFPQGLTHLSLIAASVALAEAEA